jgi:acylphosphatase
MTAIRHVSIGGRVQGVGFRAFVEHEALKRHLGGWVRNRRDSTVEALFSGEESVVADMIEACRRGPAGSRVDAVYDDDGSADDLKLVRPGDVFSVLPTA